MAQTTTLGMSRSEYAELVKRHNIKKAKARKFASFAVLAGGVFMFLFISYSIASAIFIPDRTATIPTTKSTKTTTSSSTATTPTQSNSTNQQTAGKSTPSKSNVYIPQISPTSPVAYPQINGSYGSQTYNSMQQQYDAITNRLRTQPSGTCPSGYYGGGGYGAVCN